MHVRTYVYGTSVCFVVCTRAYRYVYVSSDVEEIYSRWRSFHCYVGSLQKVLDNCWSMRCGESPAFLSLPLSLLNLLAIGCAFFLLAERVLLGESGNCPRRLSEKVTPWIKSAWCIDLGASTAAIIGSSWLNRVYQLRACVSSHTMHPISACSTKSVAYAAASIREHRREISGVKSTTSVHTLRFSFESSSVCAPARLYTHAYTYTHIHPHTHAHTITHRHRCMA